ncbi:hypothetical protein D3C75_852070 [compost metagenome]
MLHGLPAHRRPARIAYGVLVGDGRTPGVVRLLLGVVKRDRRVVQTFLPSMKGQLEGVLYYFRHAGAPAEQKFKLKEGQGT